VKGYERFQPSCWGVEMQTARALLTGCLLTGWETRTHSSTCANEGTCAGEGWEGTGQGAEWGDKPQAI
jgi:hypothetical protein